MSLAVLCSGQAGQHAAMLDEILGASDTAPLCAAASRVLGCDVAAWWSRLAPQDLFANAHAQLAITLYQLAQWQRVRPGLPRPLRVAGYSLGEVVAWHVAGALDAEATLRLVHTRAALMDRHAPPCGEAGCLLLWRGRCTPARRAARDRAMTATGVHTAIVRSGDEWVLGGSAAALDRFLAEPGIADPELKRLPVSVPSHTPALAAAVAPFATALDQSPLGDPEIPVLAGIDGASLGRREDGVAALSAQLARTLRWDWCLDSLAAAGVTVVLELGPGADLAHLALAALPGCEARSVDEFGSAAAAADWAAERCR